MSDRLQVVIVEALAIVKQSVKREDLLQWQNVKAASFCKVAAIATLENHFGDSVLKAIAKDVNEQLQLKENADKVRMSHAWKCVREFKGCEGITRKQVLEAWADGKLGRDDGYPLNAIYKMVHVPKVKSALDRARSAVGKLEPEDFVTLYDELKTHYGYCVEKVEQSQETAEVAE